MDRVGVPDLWLNSKPVEREGYTTDLITADALQFIEKHKTRPFFLYLSHAAPHFPWQGPNDREKEIRPKMPEWQQGDRETYVAMVESMDAGIGRVLDKLDELKLRDKTLVVFTSDNGGHTYSRNAPLRGAKGDLWEGGIRVPCIASWAGVLPSGKITRQVGITMDWTATFRRLAGLGADPQGEDGINLMPVLTGAQPEQERTLFWRRKHGPVRKGFEEGRSIRQGQWKLIENHDSGERFLFNLRSDIGESSNVISQQPDEAAELHKLLAGWEEDVSGK